MLDLVVVFGGFVFSDQCHLMLGLFQLKDSPQFQWPDVVLACAMFLYAEYDIKFSTIIQKLKIEQNKYRAFFICPSVRAV